MADKLKVTLVKSPPAVREEMADILRFWSSCPGQALDSAAH